MSTDSIPFKVWRGAVLTAILIISVLSPAHAIEIKGASTADSPGQSLYAAKCAQCHDGGEPRAPQRFALTFRAPESIYQTITTGLMKPMAADLSDVDRRVLAEYLSGRPFGATATELKEVACHGKKNWFDYSKAPTASSWGMVDSSNTRFIPAAIAQIKKEDVNRLKLKWSFVFPDASRARAQVAVAGGAIFVGSHNGFAYALDAESGCLRWKQGLGIELRTAAVIAPWKGSETRPASGAPLLYFGDQAGTIYALNAVSGQVVWKVKPDAHPQAIITGAPLLHEGKLYVPVSSIEETVPADPKYPCCTFRGSMAALDAATGAKIWQTFTIPQPSRKTGVNSAGAEQFGPSGAAVFNTPAIDAKRGLMFFGTDNNYSSPPDENSSAIFALRLSDGSIAWKRQMLKQHIYNLSCRRDGANCPKEFLGYIGEQAGFGGPPTIYRKPGAADLLIALAKGGTSWALNPDTGAIVWERVLAPTATVNHGGAFGIAANENLVFMPVFTHQDERTSSEGADELGLYALDGSTGNVAWKAKIVKDCLKEECRGYSAAPTVMPGVVFAAADSILRAFDSESGKLLWEFNSAREFKALNGAVAKGGSIDGSGPVISNGILYESTGYDAAHGTTPGNVLMAFSVDGK